MNKKTVHDHYYQVEFGERLAFGRGRPPHQTLAWVSRIHYLVECQLKWAQAVLLHFVKLVSEFQQT